MTYFRIALAVLAFCICYSSTVAQASLGEQRTIVDHRGTTRKIELMSAGTVGAVASQAKSTYTQKQNQSAIHVSLSSKLAVAANPQLGQLSVEAIQTLNKSLLAKLSVAVSPPSVGTPATSLKALGCNNDIGYDRAFDTTWWSCDHDANSIYANIWWPLKDYTTCIKDQGSRGTCSVFGTVAAIESSVLKKYGKSVNLSEQYLYHEIRWNFEGLFRWFDHTSDGAYPQQYFTLFQESQFVVPLESAWNYNQSNSRKEVDVGPAIANYFESCADYPETCSNTVSQGNQICQPWDVAKVFCDNQAPAVTPNVGVTVDSWAELWNFLDIKDSFNNLLATLSAGEPVALSITVTDGFMNNTGADGVVPMTPSKQQGGHVVEAVGYVLNSDLQKYAPQVPQGSGGGYIITKNSWSTCFGDGGFYYLPFDYVTTYADSAIAVYDAITQGI